MRCGLSSKLSVNVRSSKQTPPTDPTEEVREIF